MDKVNGELSKLAAALPGGGPPAGKVNKKEGKEGKGKGEEKKGDVIAFLEQAHRGLREHQLRMQDWLRSGAAVGAEPPSPAGFFSPVEGEAEAARPANTRLKEELKLQRRLNAELAEQVRWEVDARSVDSPHTKANLLLQAYFLDLALPISDYYTDTKMVLDQAIRLLQAMAC